MNGKNIVMIGIVAALMFITPTLVHGSDKGVEGNWQGTCDELNLRVLFRIWRDPNGTLAATGDSPDQEAYGIPVDKVTFEARKLRLEVDSIQGAFEGKISEDGSIIDGQWRQHGHLRPLILKRFDEVQVETKEQKGDEIVQTSEKQLQNHIDGKSHIATILILVSLTIGLIGVIALFIMKSSRR